MADFTIGADENGVHEIHLEAGQQVTVSVATRYGLVFNRVQVGVQDATQPVYAKVGNTVTVKDNAASLVMAGAWVELSTATDKPAATVAIISAADATVWVERV